MGGSEREQMHQIRAISQAIVSDVRFARRTDLLTVRDSNLDPATRDAGSRPLHTGCVMSSVPAHVKRHCVRPRSARQFKGRPRRI